MPEETPDCTFDIFFKQGFPKKYEDISWRVSKGISGWISEGIAGRFFWKIPLEKFLKASQVEFPEKKTLESFKNYSMKLFLTEPE